MAGKRSRYAVALVIVSGFLPLVSYAQATLGSPAARAATTVATDSPEGEAPFYSFKSFRISDRSVLRVNVATGNLIVEQTDLALAGRLPLAMTRYYNSMSASGVWDAGLGWQFNFGRDTRVSSPSYYDAWIRMPSGYRVHFTRPTIYSAWVPPSGFSAFGLSRPQCMYYPCPEYDRQWLLTDGSSGLHYVFAPTLYGAQSTDPSEDGHLSSVNDRHRYYGYGYSYNGIWSGWTYPPGSSTPVCGTFDKLSNTLGTVSVTRDPNQRCFATKLTDWSGRSVSYVYDAYGRLVSATDAAGGITRYGYTDPYNGMLLSSITDTRGLVTTIGYDSTGKVFSISRSGRTWWFLYGQVVSPHCEGRLPGDPPVPAALRSATLVFDPRSTGHPSNPTDWASWIYQEGPIYCVDDAARVLRIRSHEPTALDFVYDGYGNRTQVGWGNSQSTSSFDSLGRLQWGRTATGATSSLGYGDAANAYLPTQVTDPRGYTASLAYSSVGDVTRVSDPLNQTSTSVYNANGTPQSTTDARGYTTSYGYDSLGNLTSITPPAGGTIGARTLSYDSLGRVVTARDGKGQSTTYSYDRLDRITGVGYADGSAVTYGYDSAGNLTSRADVSGTTSYGYDGFNHLITERQPAQTINYGYDLIGRLVSYTDAGGTVAYQYGISGRVTAITEPTGKQTTISFDDNNAPQHHPKVPATVSYPNGVVVTNTSDLADRLTRTVARKGTVTYSDLSYGYYDPATGRDSDLIQKRTDNRTGTVTTYTYDPVGRLTSAVEKTRVDEVSFEVVASWSYAYDAAGNRTSKTDNGVTTTYTYDTANQLTSDSKLTRYGYDANGNLLSTSAGFAASYNAKNQTTSLKTLTAGPLSASYTGPGQSELATLGPDSYTNSALGISRQSGKYITRNAENGGLTSIRSGASTYYPVTDIQGSVVALTDTSGNQAAGYSYEPYGQITATTGTPALSPFRYTGALHSDALNLDKMGDRWYDPATGHWTQTDPSTSQGDYTYACSDPINNISRCAFLFGAHRKACHFVLGAAAGFYSGLVAGKHTDRLIPKITFQGQDLYIDEFVRYGIPGAIGGTLFGLSRASNVICGGPFNDDNGDDEDRGSPSGSPSGGMSEQEVSARLYGRGNAFDQATEGDPAEEQPSGAQVGCGG